MKNSTQNGSKISKERSNISDMSNLKDLLESGYCHVPIRARFSWAVQYLLGEGKELFPRIFGLDHEKRRLVEVLLGGKLALLTGPFGVAKTKIALRIREILETYLEHHSVYVVADCPIQEDPLNIAYGLGLISKKEGQTHKFCCPLCHERYVSTRTDAKNIPVACFRELREGKGFARIQGNFDIKPHLLTGTLNLSEWSRIGDQFDPRVYIPGRIGMANNGFLFIDELGKVSEAAQQTLIQVSQEKAVTPTQSRYTLPIDLLIVATANPDSEDQIDRSVFDRTTSIEVPIVPYDDELRVISNELDELGLDIYFPASFLSYIVTAVSRLRADREDTWRYSYFGPRCTIEAGIFATTSAFHDGRTIVTYCDLLEGLETAVLGKTPYEDKNHIKKKLRDSLPIFPEFFKEQYPEINFENALKEVSSSDRFIQGDGEYFQRLLADPGRYPNISHFQNAINVKEPQADSKSALVLKEYLTTFIESCR